MVEERNTLDDILKNTDEHDPLYQDLVDRKAIMKQKGEHIAYTSLNMEWEIVQREEGDDFIRWYRESFFHD